MEQNNTNSQNSNINKDDKHRLLTFVLLCAYYILSCMYLPLATLISLGTWLSAASALGVCVLSGVVLAKIAGSFKPFVFYAVTVALFAVFGGSFLPMSLLVAFVTGTCVYAYLINEKYSSFIYILPAIAPIVCVFAIGGVMGAVLALLNLPAAAFLAFSIKSKHSRISAVCRISVGICAMLVALLAVSVYKYAGAISISALKTSINAARAYLISAMSTVVNEMSTVLGMDIASLGAENLPELLVGSLFNLLPGIIIMASNILAYIIHSLYLSANYSLTPERRKESLPMLAFDMSVVSATVYILALILSLVLTSGASALYGTAAQNILLILAPGLVMTALAGVRVLSMHKGPSCLGTLLYFALIFMIASLSPIVIAMVALGGAILIIISHIARAKHREN